MRIHYIALLVGACIPATTLAATQTDSMEEKIARLEASLAKAEAQIARLEQAQQAPAVNVVSAEPQTSPAPKLTLSGYGDLRFYGDVEFNMDAASRSGSLTSMRTSANKDWARQITSAGISMAVSCWGLMAIGEWTTASLPVSRCSRWRILPAR